MKLPPQYTYRQWPGHPTGPCHTTGCCVRCGRPITDGAVPLEFDQRLGEYHDFGGVPQERSQGWFDFGPDCAEILRKRARHAIRNDPNASEDERARAAIKKP